MRMSPEEQAAWKEQQRLMHIRVAVAVGSHLYAICPQRKDAQHHGCFVDWRGYHVQLESILQFEANQDAMFMAEEKLTPVQCGVYEHLIFASPVGTTPASGYIWHVPAIVRATCYLKAIGWWKESYEP